MSRIALVLFITFTLACGGGARSVRPRRESRLRQWMQSAQIDPRIDAVMRGPLSLIQVAGMRFDLRPTIHDPITAFGACADLVTHCFNPPQSSLDLCVLATPACMTETPWNERACCPVSCREGYRAERMRGTEPMAAFERVFLSNGTCVAGVSAMVGEASR